MKNIVSMRNTLYWAPNYKESIGKDFLGPSCSGSALQTVTVACGLPPAPLRCRLLVFVCPYSFREVFCIYEYVLLFGKKDNNT